MLAIHFTFLDYFLFSMVFIVSIAIGLYSAFRSKGQQSVDEYFFGNKKFGLLPITLSLLATSLTGSTTIGQTMEVYAYGAHNAMFVVVAVLSALLTHCIFLPLFYELQLKSSFFYLELRFDWSVRLIASSLFVLTSLCVIPLTIYVPALSFQEVTGFNLHAICIVSGCLCVWYTAIGGFKAVVWTDTFQFSLIFISTLTIFVVGLISAGGLQGTWNALERGNRLDFFRTELSLSTRGSMWAYLTSYVYILIYQHNCSQSSLQRFLTLPTLKKAKQALWLQCLIFIIVITIHVIIGGTIYAIYEDCDPFKAGIVKKVDQIFSHFVQEKASIFSGFNGIYVAGSFAAGLSTASTHINTISGTIYEDFLRMRMQNISQKNISRIMKLLVIVIGLIGNGLTFVIERIGTIYVITVICYTFFTNGVFGLFCSGILFKNINSKGAKWGVTVGMVVVCILIVGNFKKSPDPFRPFRTDGCDFLNTTLVDFSMQNSTVLLSDNNDDLPWIFRINFLFYGIIGFIITIITGNVVSLLTGGNKVADQRLIAKFLRTNQSNTAEIPLENLLNNQSQIRD